MMLPPHKFADVLARVVALLASLLIAADVSAQGTQWQFPDPISATDLARWGDELGLSEGQRAAAGGLHEDYAREFQELRQKEIEALLAAPASFSEDRMAKRDRITQRIEAIDARLFDRLAEILSDDQLAVLPRVREARERDRIRGVLLVWNPFTRPAVDLSQLARAHLSADAFAALAPLLPDYEAKLTRLLRKYPQLARESNDASFRALREAGLDKLTEPTAQQWEAIRAATASTRAEGDRKVGANYLDIAALNRQTLATIEAALPVERARMLRREYLKLAYQSVRIIEWEALQLQHVERKRQQEGFSEEQEAVIAAALTAFREAIDPLIDKAVKLIDQGRAGPNAEAGSHPVELRELHDDAMGHLDGLARAIGRMRPKEPATAETADLRHYNDRWEAMGILRSFDPLLVRGMSDADIAALTAAVDLSADEQAQAWEAALAAHREAMRTHAREDHSKLLAARQMFTGEAFTPELAEQAMVDRPKALRAVHAIDAGLFDAALAIVRDDEAIKVSIERLRLARQRQWYNRGMHGGRVPEHFPGPGQRNDCNIDLAYLVPRLSFVNAGDPAIDAILREYEEAITPLMQRKWDAMLAHEIAVMEVEAEVALDRSIQTRQKWDLLAARGKTAGDAVDDAAAAIVQLNRETADRIAATLPAPAGERSLRLYDRLTVPLVHNDPASAEATLARALELNDLAPAQRSQLEQLAAEYQPNYRELTQQMIDHLEPVDSPRYTRMGDEAGIRAMQTRGRERIRLAFERHDLNVRTLNRVRGILTQEQIDAIGGIPQPPEFSNADYGS